MKVLKIFKVFRPGAYWMFRVEHEGDVEDINMREFCARTDISERRLYPWLRHVDAAERVNELIEQAMQPRTPLPKPEPLLVGKVSGGYLPAAHLNMLLEGRV